MPHSTGRLTSLFILLTCAACTQAPARVDLKGDKTFARSGSSSSGSSYNNSSYNSGGRLSAKGEYQPASVYTNTPRPQFDSDEAHQDVYVAPIEKSDLSPPPKAGTQTGQIQVSNNAPIPFSTKPTPAPVVAAAPAAPTVQAAPAEPAFSSDTGINPWTKKPRGAESSSSAPAAAASADNEQVAEIISDNASAGSLEPAAGKSSFMWPVSSKKIISPYGPKAGGAANDGINIAIAEGEPVWAAADGEVVYVGSEMKGYGNMVIIKHAGNRSTTYAHMSRSTVDKYDRVKQGDIIGYVGATGSVKDPQLHFAIRNGKDAIDPTKLLPNAG